ncbi:hypothetical protein P7C73_g3588, partial [Tremellales sp. Uapishka_1]
MSKVIVTGATGNGVAILTAALASPSISQVTVISRRPLYQPDHPKLSTILIPSDEFPKGFDEFPPSLLELVKDHKRVFGHSASARRRSTRRIISSKSERGDKTNDRITHDYPLVAAKALSLLGTPATPFRFIYISGAGTEQDESGRTLFSKIKGRTEKALKAMETPSFQTVSLRLGGIVPTAEHGKHMNFWFKTGLNAISSVFETVYPPFVIPSRDLGLVAAELARANAPRGWEERVSEGWIANKQLRKMAEEYRK